MSNEEDSRNETANTFANPLKMFGEIYNQTLKQTAEQWEETARNPLFLAAMANNVEQTMQMQKQMQEMMTTSLKALNLPAKEDFLMLVEKINDLNKSMTEMNMKLEKMSKSGETKS